jgi:hypothetical protein
MKEKPFLFLIFFSSFGGGHSRQRQIAECKTHPLDGISNNSAMLGCLGGGPGTE